MTVGNTATHKFKVGRKVSINRNVFGAPQENGTFEITMLLPAAGAEFQYRIKSLDGRVQRIVLESHLL